MKTTIFKIVISLFLVLFTIQANAQQDFIVKLKMPPLGTLNTSDFYNITVTNNSGSDQSGYLSGTAREENDGMIVQGTTDPILFKKGINNIKIKDLLKTPDVKYLASDPKYKKSLIMQGTFPSGKYEICVKVILATTNVELGSDCINQEVSETGLITSISPAKGENLDSKVPVTFTWSSAGKIPEGGFTLRICEVMENQTPEIAMKNNKAFFEQPELRNSTFTYPNSARGFEEGKTYSWKVFSRNTESEVQFYSIINKKTTQLKTFAIIQKGTYTLTNGQIMGGWGGCLCGGRNDCLCKIIAINNYSHTDLTKFSSDLSLLNLTSYVVLGNKLKIQFEERLKLVSNNFTQKEEVNVGSDLCKELGYTSVTILPGNYTITDSNSITFNIIVDNKSNDIKLISPKGNEYVKDKNNIKFEWNGNHPKEGYTISIFEIDENQYKEIKTNKDAKLRIEKPLFERTGIRENYFTFIDSSINFQDGHHYGWGVRNGSRTGPWFYQDWNTMTATAAVLNLNPFDLQMVTEFIEVWGDNSINGSYNNIKDVDEGDGQYLNGIFNSWGYPLFHIAWKIDPANVDPSYEGQEFIIKIVKLPRGPVADGYQKPDGTWVYPSSGPSCTGDAYFWHDPNDLNSVNNELNVFQSFRAYYNSNYSQYFVNMASSPPFDMLEINSQYCCKVSLGNITSNCFMFTFAP